MNLPRPKRKQLNLKKIIKGKTAVFIDAANILYSQQSLGWKMDYQKLYDLFNKNTELVGIYFYTGKIGKLEKQTAFIKRLEKLGYKVIAKEVKFIKLPNGDSLPKGNLDIELALDAYRYSNDYETIVLASGDSDFAYLLDLLKEKHKKIIVLSTKNHISRELIKRSKYIDLKKLRSSLEWSQK